MSENLEKSEEIRIESVCCRSKRDTSSTSFVDTVNLSDCDHCTRFPNRWSRLRYVIREPAAEFLGTMIFVIFGTGVNCQVFLSIDPNVEAVPRGTFLSLNLAWAAGVALGVWVSGGISGGHINPAVTFSLAVFRGFPWKKGANLRPRSAIGRVLWRWHRLCKLLSCHRHCRGWAWHPNYQWIRRSFRHICRKLPDTHFVLLFRVSRFCDIDHRCTLRH